MERFTASCKPSTPLPHLPPLLFLLLSSPLHLTCNIVVMVPLKNLINDMKRFWGRNVMNVAMMGLEGQRERENRGFIFLFLGEGEKEGKIITETDGEWNEGKAIKKKRFHRLIRGAIRTTASHWRRKERQTNNRKPIDGKTWERKGERKKKKEVKKRTLSQIRGELLYSSCELLLQMTFKMLLFTDLSYYWPHTHHYSLKHAFTHSVLWQWKQQQHMSLLSVHQLNTN